MSQFLGSFLMKFEHGVLTKLGGWDIQIIVNVPPYGHDVENFVLLKFKKNFAGAISFCFRREKAKKKDKKEFGGERI